MQADGYWYKNNKLFELQGMKHINYIIKYPKVFNLTKEEIIDTYKKYNEKIGQEGKAREELIRLVATLGWIRIRHYYRPDYWSVQFDSWSRRKKAVRNLIEYLVLEKEIMNINSDLKLLGYEDNYYVEYDFNSGGVNSFLQESKLKSKDIITIIKDFNQMQERKTMNNFLESNKNAKEYLNEDIGNIETVLHNLENIFYKYFPKSFVQAKFSVKLMPSATVVIALGKDKSEWPSGYWENDPMDTRFWIYGMDKEGNYQNLSLECSGISIMTVPPEGSYLAFGSIKVPFRKGKGDQKSIERTFESAISKLHDAVKANADDIQQAHKNLSYRVKDKVR